jgi:hypothetical protein
MSAFGGSLAIGLWCGAVKMLGANAGLDQLVTNMD